MVNQLPSGLTVPCYTVAGPAQIWVNTTAASSGTFTLQLLGWSRNGVEIQEMNIQSELKSDYGGGEQGAPDDFQWLAEMHQISIDLARWNSAPLAALARRMHVSVSSRTRGKLIDCNGGSFQCLILAENFARLYTRVFLPEPIQMAPVGTPATMPRLTLTCLDDQNIADIRPFKTTGWTIAGAAVTVP